MRHSESTLIKFFVKVKKKKKDTLQNLNISTSEKKKCLETLQNNQACKCVYFHGWGKKDKSLDVLGGGLLTYLSQVLHIYFRKYLSSLT